MIQREGHSAGGGEHHGRHQQDPRRHRRGEPESRVCLDRPYPGAAGAPRVRDRRGLHDPAGIGRGGGQAFRHAAGLRRSRKSSRGIPMSIWSRSASRCPTITSPVMAAIEAGKHVYCEWPLGRNTDEAVRMLDAAERRGRAPCRRPAGPGVAGDQLRQGPGRRGLCRPGADGDDDRLRAELGRRRSTAPTRPTSPTAPI